MFNVIWHARSSGWKAAVPYVVLAGIALVFLYPFVRYFNAAPDAGVYVNGAELVSRGGMPSRDFVEPQGPGSFVWLAVFFRLFGTTVETARAVLNGTGVAITLLTFYLSRQLGATGFFAALFVLVMTVPLSPINSPHYDSGLFALAALAVFLLPRNQAWKLALSGGLCGVTAWTIQQKGCYLALGLLISLVCLPRAKRWKDGLIFSAAFTIAALLPFVFFASVHALPEVLFANYTWPISSYSTVNAAPYGFPIWQNLGETFRQQGSAPLALIPDVALLVPFLLVAVLPLLLPVVAGLCDKRWFQRSMLPYWLTAYALWLSELHRLDMGHLRNGVIVMAIVFFSICEAGMNTWLRRLGLAASLCLALAGASNFLVSWENNRRIQTRRGALYASAPQPLLEFLEAHTHAGDNVFVYPYQPIYYFIEALRNPTRYSYLIYGFNTQAQFKEATLDLERKRVRYVVFDSLFSGERISGVFPAYREPEPAGKIMELYLEEHYRVAQDLGRFRILERTR